MKTSNSVLSAVVISVLGLSATLNAPQALAEVDGKDYPASMCVKSGGNGSMYVFAGSVGNLSNTDNLFVACPVIKDLISGSITSASMRVTDRSDTANIACTLFSVFRNSSDSTTRFQFITASTAGSSTGPMSRPFTGGPLPAFSGGLYYNDCIIPPTFNGNSSDVHMYSVTEED